MTSPTREDGLRKALDDYDAMSESGPIGDVMRDIRASAQRCGYCGNTCGSVIEWSRRYLVRHDKINAAHHTHKPQGERK